MKIAPIPPSLGYGASGAGPIPGNAKARLRRGAARSPVVFIQLTSAFLHESADGDGYRGGTMKHAAIARFALVFAAAMTGVGCMSPLFFMHEAEPNVVISPSFAVVAVGATQQMSVVVAGVPTQAVKWSVPVDSAAVLSVSASGEVSCLAEGRGSVVATPAADASSQGTATVFCGTASGAIFPASISFSHAAGTTCPPNIGRIWIMNPYTAAATYSVAAAAPLRLNPMGTFRLVPGAAVWQDVIFDCSVPSSFTAAVTVTAVVAGTLDEKVSTITVTGTIVK